MTSIRHHPLIFDGRWIGMWHKIPGKNGMFIGELEITGARFAASTKKQIKKLMVKTFVISVRR